MTGANAATALPETGRDERAAVHEWRVARLTRLGLPLPVADEVADRVDWHEIARLVERGCPAELALAIVR